MVGAGPRAIVAPLSFGICYQRLVTTFVRV